MRIRTVLVDDHAILREGIRSCLEQYNDIEVVAEASDGRGALTVVKEQLPDVVVMDVSMKELNGVDATRKILAENPRVRVVALSMHSDRRFVSQMLGAGASGYVLKDCAVEELADAIRSVSVGRVFLSAGITEVVVDDYVRKIADSGSDGAASPLSEREREVLQLLAEGRSTKEIAFALHLSVKTIETHRGRIMEKLQLSTVAELTKYAVREGLTSLDE